MKTHLQFYSEVNKFLHDRLDDKEFASQIALKIAVLSSLGVNPEVELAGSSLTPKVTASTSDTVAKVSGFQFGTASLKELQGVNADLVRVVHLALSYCVQDFCVYDGIRTIKEQQQHIKDGTSKTMQSKHLDGLAVDLVPWANGKPTWDWNLIWPIAYAMDRAATKLGFADRITWGGAWDRRLSDFGGDSQAYKKVVAEYEARHPGKDFIDGPHYEILP